ncbi:hypothetical protein [Abyssisolibacter fermentans]|uniref:hypothetical protein n=1 Tax=Abyssisolibacter fermentans TaxID=1766203 RepID=UPI00082AD99A|nr:hypothetical protein [Abyssisolibacter fermentans]
MNNKMKEYELQEARRRMNASNGMTSAANMGTMTNATTAGMGSSLNLANSTSVGQEEMNKAKQHMNNSAMNNLNNLK